MKFKNILLLIVFLLFAINIYAASPEYITGNESFIIQETVGWGNIGYNTACVNDISKPMPLIVNGKTYEKGIGVHAESKIIIALDGKYKLFETEVGTQQYYPDADPGSVVFKILLDGKEVFKSKLLRASESPVPVKLDITGAYDMTLIVEDGGDGKNCDGADWLNARLTKNENFQVLINKYQVDISKSARVTRSNPKRTDGTKVSRIETFPAEDIFLVNTVFPDSKGRYIAKPIDNQAAIGLTWLERKKIRSAEIEFSNKSDIPKLSDIKLEAWVTPWRDILNGETMWQGQWVRVNAKIAMNGNKITANIGDVTDKSLRYGVLQLRWIFPAKSDVAIKAMPVYTRSNWSNEKIYISAVSSKKQTAKLIAYNGAFLNDKGQLIYSLDWDMSKPINLNMIYNKSFSNTMEKTVIRFKSSDNNFAVLIKDLFDNDAVYSKDFGVFCKLSSQKITLSEYIAKNKSGKKVLDMTRSMPEQTLNNALTHIYYNTQNFSPTVISLACDNRKILIGRDGKISFDDDPKRYDIYDRSVSFSGFDLGAEVRINPIFGFGNVDLKRRLDADWVPILNHQFTDKDVIYTQKSFVAPYETTKHENNFSWWYDKPLGVIEWEIENTSKVEAPAQIKIDFEFLTQPEIIKRDNSVIIVKNGKVMAVLNNASNCDFEIGKTSIILKSNMKFGERKSLNLLIPRWDITPNDNMPIWSADLIKNTDSYWRGILKENIDFEIPDKLHENIIKASIANCYIAARNANGNLVSPWIAATVYGPLESEAQSIIRGMQYWGQKEFAKRSHDYYFSIYRPEGYLANIYTLLGNGWHLWCVGEYYDLFKDIDWIKDKKAVIERNVGWTIEQLNKTKKLEENGERVKEYGLFPPGVCADWNTYAYYFISDSYAYAGLKSATEMLRDMSSDVSGDADSAAIELKDNTLAAYKSVRDITPLVKLQNGEWVPNHPTQLFSPGPVGDLYPGDDFGRSWCYDAEIGSHHLIAKEIIDPKSRDAQWILDYLEDHLMLESGWGAFPKEKNYLDIFNNGGFTKVQPYYARNIEIQALRDDIKPFLRSYFNTIAAHINLEDLSLWEHLAGSGAINKTHETGYFLYQSRTMLLTERDNDLWLAPFIPAAWMIDGGVIKINNAPSKFGSVSMEINSSLKSSNYVVVNLNFDFRDKPSKIVLRSRHPLGLPIKSVELNGKNYLGFNKDLITLSPRLEKMRVVIHY